MSQNDKAKGTTLPSSLRNFLTVTEADGAPRTGLVEPSPLLSRIKEFLPHMAAANEALEHAAPEQSAVEVEKVVGQAAGESSEQKSGPAVDMDLYVDESMGKLVGTTFEAEEDSEEDAESSFDDQKSAPAPPLIEVITEESKDDSKKKDRAEREKETSP